MKISTIISPIFVKVWFFPEIKPFHNISSTVGWFIRSICCLWWSMSSTTKFPHLNREASSAPPSVILEWLLQKQQGKESGELRKNSSNTVLKKSNQHHENIMKDRRINSPCRVVPFPIKHLLPMPARLCGLKRDISSYPRDKFVVRYHCHSVICNFTRDINE